MNGSIRDGARTYWENITVNPVDPETGPVLDEGNSGGGTIKLRHDRLWMDDESILYSANWRAESFRRSVEHALKREQARAGTVAAGGTRWLQKPERLTSRPLRITVELILYDDAIARDDETRTCGYRTTIDVPSEDSVDEAMESLRLFTIESFTAARTVEQDRSRELSAGFWSDWVGA